MKNGIEDLNNYLFEQLEKLNDSDLSDEELEKEIKRSKAVTSVADTIIKNASLALDVIKIREEYGLDDARSFPAMLGDGKL